jgi:hypothetical protein
MAVSALAQISPQQANSSLSGQNDTTLYLPPQCLIQKRHDTPGKQALAHFDAWRTYGCKVEAPQPPNSIIVISPAFTYYFWRAILHGEICLSGGE